MLNFLDEKSKSSLYYSSKQYFLVWSYSVFPKLILNSFTFVY
jgi:hypothetical protein